MSTTQEKFFSACKYGDLSDVTSLSLHLIPSVVDVNRRDSHDRQSGLYHACVQGNASIVRFLLSINFVDINLSNGYQQTPFYVSCACGHEEIVELLLKDPRTDVCKPNMHNWTPLWNACWRGKLNIVKILLASGRDMDLHRRACEGDKDWNSTTAAEIARKKGFVEIAEIVEGYARNSAEMIKHLRYDLNIAKPEGELLAAIIFICEGFLKIRPSQPGEIKPEEKTDSKVISRSRFVRGKARIRIQPNEETAKRFFKIASSLHFDLQLLLAKRYVGSAGDLIPSFEREVAFKKYANLYKPEPAPEWLFPF